MKNDRRNLLKALTVSGGTFTVLQLPTHWSRPVVESVVLPAHAQTTGQQDTPLRQAATSGTTAIEVMVNMDRVPGLLETSPALARQLMDAYLPEAHAVPALQFPADAQVFGKENANGKWEFEIFLDFGNLCESTSQFFGVCDQKGTFNDDSNPLDAFALEAHAGVQMPEIPPKFQSLYVTDPLAVGEFNEVLFPTFGCDFGVIGFTFHDLNGDSPEVAIFDFTIDLFPGNKPFGLPECDADQLPSDRNIKNQFQPIDEQDILERVSQMPIEYWKYTDRDHGVRHIGPMAQDFHAAFDVGDSDLHIHAVDANGVNLASIKALYQRLQEKDARIATLETDLAAVKEKLGLPS